MAGEPGNFTVTLKKPGEKIEFDVPYPLPEEMKVDESGKELNAEQLHERYMEYNKGTKGYPDSRSRRRKIRRRGPGGRLASGKPIEGEAYAHLGYGELPDVVTNEEFEAIAKAGKIDPPLGRQSGQSVVFIQSPGQGG